MFLLEKYCRETFATAGSPAAFFLDFSQHWLQAGAHQALSASIAACAFEPLYERMRSAALENAGRRLCLRACRLFLRGRD